MKRPTCRRRECQFYMVAYSKVSMDLEDAQKVIERMRIAINAFLAFENAAGTRADYRGQDAEWLEHTEKLAEAAQ
jgi:hypothetical protein